MNEITLGAGKHSYQQQEQRWSEMSVPIRASAYSRSSCMRLDKHTSFHVLRVDAEYAAVRPSAINASQEDGVDTALHRQRVNDTTSAVLVCSHISVQLINTLRPENVSSGEHC